MLFNALFFLLGVVIFSSKTNLEFSTIEITVFVLIFTGILASFRRIPRLSINILFALSGFIWMSLFSQTLLNQSVDDEFLNRTIETQGFIASLPSSNNIKSIFTADSIHFGILHRNGEKNCPFNANGKGCCS